MSQIESLFATRLYRAALSERGKPVDVAELETSCLSIAEDDEAEIKLVKDLLKELADAPKDKPRSVELFKKFADRKICEVSETNVKLIIHEPLVNREVKDSIQHKKRNEGGNFNKGGQRGGYNNRGRGAH